MSASMSEIKSVSSAAYDGSAADPDNESSNSPANDVRVLFLTSFLPYPSDHGGAMAREGFIRAIAASATVSVLVLTSIRYDEKVVRAAESYYRPFRESFPCRQFSDPSPSAC